MGNINYFKRAFSADEHGTCERCKAENVELVYVPGDSDAMHLCRACYEETEICDECGIIYPTDEVEFTYTDDGRTICEWCAQDIGDEENEYGEDDE